ncbi:MAG: SET domain-containing protein [Patescibacteria group bacterium]
MPIEKTPGGERWGSRDFFRGRGFVKGQDKLVNNETDLLKVVETKKTGKGLVAKAPIKEGARIFGIQGSEEEIVQERERKFSKSKADRSPLLNLSGNPDLYLPNSICVGQKTAPDGRVINTMLDPDDDNPLRFINHSCDPNARRMGPFAIGAFRDIAVGEPITIDYSILEVNPEWRMKCLCGSPDCRGEIRSVQYLTPKQIEPSWKDLPGFIKRIYMQSAEKRFLSQKDKEVLNKLKENMESFGFGD